MKYIMFSKETHIKSHTVYKIVR